MGSIIKVFINSSRIGMTSGFLVALLLLFGNSIFAQGTRGTIRGTVTDPNGAVVANASIQLIDAQKGTIVRNVTTNEEGVYQLVEIEPSNYYITINAAGFSELRLNEFKLEVNRNLTLDATITVGTGVSEVTVTAGAEIIDRESPTLGTTVENRRVQGLPLNGRNVLNLALLQPGVTPGAGGLGIRVNGSRSTENNITIDGASNNEVAVGGTVAGIARPDAVQEFRLLTSNFEAEYGRNTGSVINVVTRSGTNEYHGNARIFYRPTFLSAANFFDNALTPANLQGTDRRQKFERKEFGFNIGGPVKFLNFGEGGPVIYDGRDKTFFFVDYERRAQKIGGSVTINNLPTSAERRGDFSALLAQGIVLYDPATATAANPQGNPFPGNIIPTSRFSPIAQYYLNFFPQADANGQALASNDNISNVNYFTGRFDHNFTPNHLLSFTYNLNDGETANGQAFQGTPIPGFGDATTNKSENYVGRYTAVLNPKVVNTFLFSYSRNDFPSGAPVNTTTPAQIGFTANFVANGAFAGPPTIFLDDRGLQIGNGFQGPQSRVSENIQFQDSVSYVLGNHRLKFGFDFVKYKQAQEFLFINNGIFGYGGQLGTATSTTGNDLADFIIGNTPDYVQFGSAGVRDFRQTAYAGFIQDNWRVSNNLTLSLGLRYEYNSPLTDTENRVAYYRAGATSPQLINGSLTFEGRQITVAPGGRAPNGLVYVGDPDPVLGGTVPAGGIRPDRNNFAPRLGFAYALNDESFFNRGFLKRLIGDNQTVIRGGAGMFYGAIIGDTALQQLSATGYEGTNAYFDNPGGTLANPFGADPFPFYSYLGGPKDIIPASNPFTATDDILIAAPLAQAAQPIDPLLKTPIVTQYNLSLERSFARDYVFSASYVGNIGRKLYVAQVINPAVGTLLPVSLRFQGGAIPTPTTSNANSRRINGDIPVLGSQLTTRGRSRFDSMQLNFQKRLSDDGLSFQLAYTLSKSFSDGDNQRSGIDILDQRAGYSLSNDDRPHRFVASFIYELPFFRQTQGFTKRLIDGWSIGAIYTYQSGDVFSVNNPLDTVGTGGGVVTFADSGSASFQNVDPRQGTGADRFRAFNANAFAAFTCGTTFQLCINPDGTRGRRGTSGRNQYRLDNTTNNVDAILSKRTRLFSESTSLELRFEAFNLFNRVQFNGTTAPVGSLPIDLNLNSAGFGTYRSAAQARVIQLGARINF